MSHPSALNVSIIGAGSTYGIFLVKWALQLKHYPETNRENIQVPAIGTISYSNTTDRNKNLVMDVLLNDLSQMPSFASAPTESFLKDVHGYTNWREMIAKESPGLVVICSPLETHIPYLRELLSDFKVPNILCEPPLSHLQEIGSLSNLIQLCKEKKVTVGINQQYAIFYEQLKNIPLNPKIPAGKDSRFGDLLSDMDSLHITFITHGTRIWRRLQGVGEQELLEDLGPHIYELIPHDLREKRIEVKNVKKEGDNLFLNFVEYDLVLGAVPIRLTLGYHRKLKSLKILIKKEKKDYEFHVSGTTNPETGEHTRWIEGKNYAYPFKHFLNSDLVKTSFISSLSSRPIVSVEEAVKSMEFIRSLRAR